MLALATKHWSWILLKLSGRADFSISFMLLAWTMNTIHMLFYINEDQRERKRWLDNTRQGGGGLVFASCWNTCHQEEYLNAMTHKTDLAPLKK